MRARALMRFGALVSLYRRRLRVHGVQELLAGLGIASSVALVFATLVASGSVAGSSAQLVHEVIGPATLQLRARGADGFDERTLTRVERLSGVKQAAPLLEQTATIEATDGRRLTVSLAGADTALTVLDGLAHTLPRETLASGAVGLSQASAQALGSGGSATLLLRGQARRLRVSEVLGARTAGPPVGAACAVLPLADLQRVPGVSRPV